MIVGEDGCGNIVTCENDSGSCSHKINLCFLVNALFLSHNCYYPDPGSIGFRKSSDKYNSFLLVS